MAENVTLIKIFVASPGDVNNERKRVSSVIAELNRTISPFKKVLLKFVGWEHVVPDIGKAPQETIDSQIGPYDIFIGIMWKRFGKPTSQAGSGTEHEFNLAYKHRKKFGIPRILFYFCQRPYAPKKNHEIEQWGKVFEFKKKVQKAGLTKDYKNLRDFEKILREHLTIIVLNWDIKPKKRKKAPDISGRGSIREIRDFIISAGNNRETDKEEQLIEFAKSHKSLAIRQSAIVALRKIGSTKALPIFISVLTTQHENKNLRESAIKALVDTGDKGTLKHLRGLTRSKTITKFGKKAVQKALARLQAKLAKAY